MVERRSSRGSRRAASTEIQSVRATKSNRGSKSGRGSRSRKPASGASWLAKLLLAGKVVGVAAAVTGLAYGGYRAHRFVTTTESFAVEVVEVKGLVRAERDEVLALAGVSRGDNLFALDAGEVERSVKRHPWVKDASVQRVPPKKLSIEVHEHVPVVLVALGNLYYADESGEIVKRYAPGETERLPVVTGIQRAEIESGDPRAKSRLRSAINFLADLSAVLGEKAPAVEEIHLDPARGLDFVPLGEQVRVSMGTPPWRARLEKLGRVRAALEERGLDATEITLGGERRPERVVARLAKAEQTPANKP